MALSNTDLITELYIGYFNRAPDPAGLQYWLDGMSKGVTFSQIADQFAKSSESTAIYPYLTLPNVVSPDSFINQVYQNVLGRPAEPAGLAYWKAALQSGVVTTGGFISTIIETVNKQSGTADALTLQHKLTVAEYYTTQIATNNIPFAQADAKAALAGVDSTDASVALGKATVDATVQGGPPGVTFPLTTGADVFVGTAASDTINGGLTDSFSAFDNIDGGGGNDTLNVLTTASTVPGGVTVKNVENININTTAAGYTLDSTAFAGAKKVTVSDSAQAAGAITINGTAATSVVTQGQTTGTISIGATTAPTGAVTIQSTGSAASGAAVGAITVTGGTTVSVAQTTTNSTAVNANGANGTATGSAVTVTGTASTTSVTVKESAPVSAVAGVPNVTESAIVTWQNMAAVAGTQSIGGATITSDGLATHTAAEVATVAAGGTVAGLTLTATPSLWTISADTATTSKFTSVTPNANVADIGGAGFTGAGNAAPTAVTTQGSAFVQGVLGVAAGNVTITDANASSATAAGTITSVSLENFGVATANSSALNAVTLAGKGTSFTQTNGALTTAIVTSETLNLNGVTTTGSVNLGATPKTVNVVSTSPTATGGSTLQTLAAASATAINISGDKALTLTNHTFDAAAVITSTSTGAVTISDALGNAQQYTGGAGVDTITVGATTKAITTGAGNDVVNLTVAALGTGGSIDAGAGTGDVLAIAAADAVTASAATTFAASVKGFEILKLAANAAANPTVDLANLNNGGNNSIHTVEFAATNTDSITLANLTSGDTIQFDAAQTAGKTVTASITGAVASTTDVLNIKVTNVAGIDVKTIDASNIETVNFLTNDTANDANAAVATTHLQHTAALTDAAAKTITVSGDAGLSLAFTGTALTSFDASGVTDGAISFTTGALANAAVIKGGAYSNSIDFTAATKAVTYTGGAGADTLNFSADNSQANVISLGDGANTITGGVHLTGNNTITGGSGVDTIVVGNGNNTISVGAGADFVTVGSGSNTVTLGAGADTLTIGAVNQSSAIFTTVTDIAAGDVINNGSLSVFAGVVGGKLGAALTSGVNDYQTFLNNAASQGVGHVSWFQYGGDTYLVEDNSAAATFTGNADLVIKFTGLVDLSNSTLANGGHAITIA
ncbi:DUF4214 domain-containing protein [Rhodopseudomonas palustris]|uniref:DUF4214 domain-containing protein n=1 Tax=Rhodopseudomonas palustris TaxID=1076 RepID=UPI000D1B237E|nr:DUF4214 domain-containing protein [Rhodopseudomonas palustris]AVT82969.1 hypothetical protein RPYSC3_41090 [Rhodopseudomonas palustris]